MRRGGQHGWRWAVVAAAGAALVAVPFAAHLLPGGDSDIAASTLLTRISASADVPFSGYAQSQGGLSLPVADSQFNAIDDLFGGTSRLRVWWRAERDWRVDTLAATGEQDLYRDDGGTWSWNYESNAATRNSGVDQVQVRLPRADDLLPGNLARRLLSEAAIGHVRRIAGVRVAGHETAGLRLTVDDARSTISHIDVWALPSDGLPVRVAVYGSGPRPVLSASFLDLDVAAPAAAVTHFVPSPGARLEDERFGDIVAAVDAFGRSAPPATAADLPRRTDLNLGAVGVYGSGATVLVAIPLSPRLAYDVVPQLRSTPGAVEDGHGISAAVGPLSIQLSPPVDFGSRWLLVGTLTPATLRAAVADLPPVQGFGAYHP